MRYFLPHKRVDFKFHFLIRNSKFPLFSSLSYDSFLLLQVRHDLLPAACCTPLVAHLPSTTQCLPITSHHQSITDHCYPVAGHRSLPATSLLPLVDCYSPASQWTLPLTHWSLLSNFTILHPNTLLIFLVNCQNLFWNKRRLILNIVTKKTHLYWDWNR